MKALARSLAVTAVVVVTATIGAGTAPAAPRLTVEFHYDDTVDVDGTFTLTSITTTTTSATVTGQLDATATLAGITVAVHDQISATFTPVCGATTSTLTVDFASFDVTVAGFTFTVDLAPFTFTVATDSRVGGLICAFADVLAHGGSTQAVRQVLRLGLAAAA